MSREYKQCASTGGVLLQGNSSVFLLIIQDSYAVLCVILL